MDGMDSSHSKEGFFEGQVKKKGLGLFGGNKERTKYGIQKNEIIRV